VAEQLESAERPIAQAVQAQPTGPSGRGGPERPGDVLRGIARLTRTIALYGADHPVTAQSLGEVHGLLRRILTGRSPLRLSIYEDTFFVGNTILLEESLQLFRLLSNLKERQIGTVELHEGVEAAEFQRFVDLLHVSPQDLHGVGGARAWLKQQQVFRISVGPAPDSEPRLTVDPRDAFRSALRVMDGLNYQASRWLPFDDLWKAKLVIKSLTDIVTEDRFALLGLTAIKGHDEDTCHHSVNVGILSLLMGSYLEFNRTLMAVLGMAALLHDIGKTLVPREILAKPGTLTPAEQEVIKRHTLYGARLLRDLPDLARLAMIVAFEHHANYDLSGYPRMTAKTVPHLLTRIVQLADFYDATTSSRRVFRPPMLPAEAMLHILDGAGRLFDPILARSFAQLLGLYPVGSVVELDTDELAIVIRPGERDAARPVVQVVRSSTWEPLEPYVVRLEEERQRRVVRALSPAEAGVDVAALLQRPSSFEDASEIVRGRGGA
jgi:putative nucleotidyltransferase with HDIG domain